MAKAYLELYSSALQIKEFFGLRDFYRYVKHLNTGIGSVIAYINHKASHYRSIISIKHIDYQTRCDWLVKLVNYIVG